MAELPPERGSYSYGTVSPDHRYYAVSVQPPDGGPSKVHLLDLQTKQWSVLLDKPGYHAKHEQFSRDGRNRVLIQLNQMPDVKVVLLSELEIGGAREAVPGRPALHAASHRPRGLDRHHQPHLLLHRRGRHDQGKHLERQGRRREAHAGVRGQTLWACQRLARREVLDRRHRREGHSDLHRQLRDGPVPSGPASAARSTTSNSGATRTRT